MIKLNKIQIIVGLLNINLICNTSYGYDTCRAIFENSIENSQKSILKNKPIHEFLLESRELPTIAFNESTLNQLNNLSGDNKLSAPEILRKKMYQVNETSFQHLDLQMSQISKLLAKRLTRKMNAFRFVDSEAKDIIEIPNFGSLIVTLKQEQQGIVYISKIKSERFEISNNRRTGRGIQAFWNDKSLPQEITIPELGLKAQLHSEDLGIQIELNGQAYTNRVVYSAHKYTKNQSKNSLYPLVGAIPFEIQRNPDALKEYVQNLGIIYELNWNSIESQLSNWFEREFIQKLEQMPENKTQINFKPVSNVFPQRQIGNLEMNVTPQQLKSIQSHLSKNSFSDSFALIPMLSLADKRDHLSFDQDTLKILLHKFIFTSSQKFKLPENHWLKSRLSYNSYVNEAQLVTIEIVPQTSDQIYVVDLSSEELSSIASSLVSLEHYKYNYQFPMFLVARPLSKSEIKINN